MNGLKTPGSVGHRTTTDQEEGTQKPIQTKDASDRGALFLLFKSGNCRNRMYQVIAPA